MELYGGFAALLQAVSAGMTSPTFDSFVTIVTGWIFASRRTVTRMILAAGSSASKHYSSYHRLFSAARWSLDRLGLAVFALVEPHLDGEILLGLDDTLARKRGAKMFGAAMHYDPLLSRGRRITSWGHNWVVLGAIVELPFRPGRRWFLPILFRLYLSQKQSAKHRRVHRTRPELAVEMLGVLCGQYKNRRFHAVGDAAYGGQSVLVKRPINCQLTSRLLLTARLYDAPPPRRAGQRGRPRVRGARLPSPEAMLDGRCRRTALDVYGRTDQARIADCAARLHHAPRVPVRVVALEPLSGGRLRQAFYSTRTDARAEDVLAWYAMRWSVEVAFHDSKQHLGFGHPQGWTPQAAQRTAPVAMLLYGLVLWWFDRQGHRYYRPLDCPWYVSKTDPSFADMLATLRRLSLRTKLLSLPLDGRGSRKIKQLLENAVALAA
jgi:hypothetical protein